MAGESPETDLALIKHRLGNIDKKLDDVLAYQKEQNGRLSKVEDTEITCSAQKTIDHMQTLWDERQETKGALNLAKWLGGGGGLAGMAALVMQILKIFGGP